MREKTQRRVRKLESISNLVFPETRVSSVLSPDSEVVYEVFCALIVRITPIDGRCLMEDEFFAALEVVVDEQDDFGG